MDNGDLGSYFASLAGAGIVFLLIWLVILAGMTALTIWITYTVIWRAVRRGLYEYHNPRPTRASQDLRRRVNGPRDW